MVQGHALPLGQGVDHLGVPPGGGDVEGDGPLHAAQVVVQASGRLHEERRGHPAQVERTAQRVLKEALQESDGLLGVVEIQAGGVPLGNIGLIHYVRLLTLFYSKRYYII